MTQSPLLCCIQTETRRDPLYAQVGFQGHDAPVPCRRAFVWRDLRTTCVMLLSSVPL